MAGVPKIWESVALCSNMRMTLLHHCCMVTATEVMLAKMHDELALVRQVGCDSTAL